MKELLRENLNRVLLWAIIFSILFSILSLLIPDTYSAQAEIYVYKISIEGSEDMGKLASKVIGPIAYSADVRSGLITRLNFQGLASDNIKGMLKIKSDVGRMGLFLNLRAAYTDKKAVAQIANLWSEALIAEYQRLFPEEAKGPYPKLALKVISKAEEPRDKSYPNRKAIGFAGFLLGAVISCFKIKREKK